MGLERLELSTPALSEQCSNQLSYRPEDNTQRTSFESLDVCDKILWSIMRTSRLLEMTLHRKEVIQPHLPIQLPCYDLAPINGLTLGALFLAVREATSGTAIFHGLTGGVYKARERIHRGMLIRDY